MNLCVIIDAWEPIWGGGQEHVWQICKRLDEKYKYSIDIYTRSLVDDDGKLFENNEKYNNKLNIIRLGPTTKFFNLLGRFFWVFIVIYHVWKNHQKKPYTLIHGHAYLAAIPVKILNLLLHIPVVFTVHGSNNLDLYPKKMIGKIERFLLTSIPFDKEISVSKHFLTYKNVNKNVDVITNGVDFSEFNKKKVRKKSHTKFKLLFIGRFDKVKGIELLIRAFSEVIKIESNIFLDLVGYGYEEDKLVKLSKILKTAGYIKFHGKKSHTELIKFYKDTDIFILPSLSEGQSITLLEACAAKLPIIASPVGDNKFFVKNNFNGYLIDPINEESLINAIVKAKNNPKLKTFGKNSYKLVRKFTWERAVFKHVQIYQNIMRKKHYIK